MPYFVPGGGYFALTATDRVIGSDAGAGQLANNVILGGRAAGSNLGVGVDNIVALGVEAFDAGCTDVDSAGTVAIGTRALTSLVLGEHNIAIGFEAAENFNGATARDNVVIGFRAASGVGNTVPQRSVIIGSLAAEGYTNPVSNCVYIGTEAGRGVAASGVRNVAIGSGGLAQGPLHDITTGGNNIAIGFEALRDVNSANQNIAIGSGAGDALTTGSRNTIVGHGAASALTNEDNVIIGNGAATTVSPGDENVIIGSTASESISPGARNIIIGFRSARGGVAANFDDTFIVETFLGAAAQPFLYGEIADGNLILGNTVAANQPTDRDLSGTNVFKILSGTAPSANPVGGGFLYVTLGALNYRGSAGTITALAAA